MVTIRDDVGIRLSNVLDTDFEELKNELVSWYNHEANNRLQVLQGDLQLNGDYERVENLRNVNEKFVEYLSGEEGEEVLEEV
ncbi:MAG: hypothetical protein MUP58_03360, partial [Candidatus Nanohaloarchaeota archaeon QJJ-9]|nr:hypothetical protein [Candidatus Nanohaloarchaeota archaeon QJJ-9]